MFQQNSGICYRIFVDPFAANPRRKKWETLKNVDFLLGFTYRRNYCPQYFFFKALIAILVQ